MIRGLLAASTAAAIAAASASAGTYSPPPGDHSPVWSPDGTAIVYLARSGGSRSLRVMDPDGRGDRLLPLPPFVDVGPTTFVFSPDWFWVALGGGELVVSRPDGSERRRLSDTIFGTPPAWSPDGRTLAFARGDGLHAIGVDGSGLRRLAPRGSYPAWSPDGALIAFVGGPPDRPEIRIVGADGSAEHVLTDLLVGSGPPVWSPDGSRLAFLTKAGEFTWNVTVATRDGAVVAQFRPPFYVSKIDWSRDGHRLLLSGSRVDVADVETGQLRLLVPFGGYAVWSPSGGDIAFEGGGECKDRTAIHRVGADGGPPTRLTNDCRIVGTDRSDRLEGTELADVLLGGAGDDVLGAYDPSYVGDDLYGGPGDDELTGHYRGDRLEGGSGADSLEGLTGPDYLDGGAGRDVLQGNGGKDYLDAEDGARDDVLCGTNRSRSTGPELDTAFVDRFDRAIGCELLYRTGRADLRAGRTAVTIAVARDRTTVEWTLRCRPAGGTLPGAAAACRRLAAMRGPLAPVAYDRQCAPTDESPRARIRGLFAGRRVVVDFDRRDECAIERWNRHRFLLEPR